MDPAAAYRLALLLARFARPTKVRLRKRHTVAFAPLRMTDKSFICLKNFVFLTSGELASLLRDDR